MQTNISLLNLDMRNPGVEDAIRALIRPRGSQMKGSQGMSTYYSKEDIRGFENFINSFPLSIPIMHENKEVGEISLRLRLKVNKDREMLSVFSAMREMILMPGMIKNILEISKGLLDRVFSKNGFPNGVFLNTYLTPMNHNEPGYEYSMEDEDIYETIREHGPDALLIQDCRHRLMTWLLDPEAATSQMNAVRDCLLDYARSKSPTIAPKVGRRRTRATRECANVGTGWLKELLKDMTKVLAMTKRIRGNRTDKDFTDTLNRAFLAFFKLKREKLLREFRSPENSNRINRISNLLRTLQQSKDNPVSSILRRRGEVVLRKEFEEFEWIPYKMALVLTARLTNAGAGTINNILHPPK